MHRPYRKFIIAMLGVILGGLNVFYHGNADLQMVISLATALGVYAVPNEQQVK